MPQVLFPSNEAQRQEALRKYQILDSAPEAIFDRIVALAARMFNVPIALINLIDQNRYWIKANHGLEDSQLQQGERQTSFCAYTILSDQVLVVPDAQIDTRFADNPHVAGQTKVRFYAGAPLQTSDGYNLGTICVVDSQPRTFSEAEQANLQDLAAVVINQLELRLAARKLEESEERFRSMVQHSSDVITVLDVDGVYQYVSPSAAQIVGYQPADLLGKRSLDYIHPEDLLKVQTALTVSLTQPETPVLIEFRYQRADKEWVYLEAIGNNLLANPHVNGIVVNARDITGRKEAEQQLLLLERAVAASISSIIVADATLPDNPVVYANATFEATTGYNAAEILGRNCRFLQGPERDQPNLEELRIALREEKECQVILHNYRKDGTPFWNELKISPVRNDSGQVTHFIGIQNDITARRQAELLLVEQNKLLEMVASGQALPLVLEKLALVIEQQLLGMLCSILLLDESGTRLWNGASPSLGASYIEAINGVTIGPKVGSCGTAAYLRERVIVSDITTDPLWDDYRELALSHNLKACWSQPIFSSSGKVLGTFAMYYREPIQPDAYSLNLIEDAIHIAGIAIESKQIESAVRRSEEQFRLIFELTPTGMVLVGLDGRLLRVNPAICQLLGYSAEELLNLTFRELTHPDDLLANVEFNKKLLTGEINSYQMEKRYIRRDGRIVNAILQAGMMKDTQGQPLHLISQVVDITERRQVEEQLAAEKERLAVTLRSIGDGVITTDTSGQVVLLNQAAEELTGYQQADAIGQPLPQILQLLEPKTRRMSENQVEQSLQAGQSLKRTHPVVLLNQSGSEHLVIDTSAPIRNETGQVLGAVVAFRDVTDQQRIAEELLKSSKLEALGLLAGGIAHDFNNILTAILGNLSLARSYTEKETELTVVLEEAQQACIQAKELTFQLLTFARGGAPIKQAALLPQLIQDSTQFAIRGSGVQCLFDLDANLWPVEVDKGQLSQVIQNLIINAIQAMPEGGIIHVAANNLRLEEATGLPLVPGDYVQLSVADEGVGIAPEQLSKIFDPYFTTKERGSGLGLATCYSIIKKHDGYIGVKSTVGMGTTFEIYLPATLAQVETMANAAQRKEGADKEGVGPRHKSSRVLLMDDEPLVGKTVSRLLQRLGYEVVVVKDGLEALEYYQKAQETGRPFDIVIMDLTIPGGLGGKETIQKLLKLDPQVKAIVSSGYSENALMAHYQDYGFKGMIAKPYTLKELARVVEEVILSVTV